MRPKRSWLWTVVLAVMVLTGCHEAVLWEPRPEFVSQVAERIDTLEFRDGDLPVFRLEEMEVLGDLYYTDYEFARRMTASRLEDGEQLVRLTNLVELRRVGGPPIDPLASYTVDTCTDCSVGPRGRLGRTFVFRRENGRLVLSDIWLWGLLSASGASSPAREEDVARILLTP